MPYIMRADGERFIIPSYRDVLSAKKKNLLKRQILLLTTSYGEYITLQRKNVDQYEVAFSPEPGFLLGETVWHYFKRPYDLIYCEAIPNTTEAILVIVKSGSVYLDGSFPIDSILDELVIFRTQQNHFDIYIYGDVPISKEPEEGKFSFDASSVKSFTVLDAPVFPTLPTVKAFQLQLVDVVLRSQGIGVFPIKQLIALLVLLGLLWMGWTYLTTHKKELPTVIVRVVNPYQLYIDDMVSPDPFQELEEVVYFMKEAYSLPGWRIETINYQNGKLMALMRSYGASTSVLFSWANRHNFQVQIKEDGIYLVNSYVYLKRPLPTTINPLNDVIGAMIDRLAYILPGNNITVSTITNRGVFSETNLTINFKNISPTTLDLIGREFKFLPLVMISMSIKITPTGFYSGMIVLQALGN